jgi:prevent-host-death family protein
MKKSASTGRLLGGNKTARGNTPQSQTKATVRVGGGREVQARFKTSPKKSVPKHDKPKIAETKDLKQISATDLKTRTAEAIQAAIKAPVAIVKNGRPILVMLSQEYYDRLKQLENPQEKKPFPFDCAKDDQLVPDGDEWWQPMNDDELEEFLEGKS